MDGVVFYYDVNNTTLYSGPEYYDFVLYDKYGIGNAYRVYVYTNDNHLQFLVMDTIKNSNINKKMKKIKGSIICVGNGGSNVVASFASLVLNKKNNCPCKLEEARDVLYENIKDFDNLFVCSYSGTHLGVNILKPLKIKKYLLTYGEEDKSYITLKCSSNVEKEKSFISLATTLMPMSVLLSCYESNCTFFVKKELDEAKKADFL